MQRASLLIASAVAGIAGAIAVGVGSAGAQAPPTGPPVTLTPCAAGQTPTPSQPCLPAGVTPPPGVPQQPGGPGGPGGPGSGLLPTLPKCAPGVFPSPASPCMMDANMPDCGPAGPPKLNPDGSLPAGAVPCKPSGVGPQFTQAPPPEATTKLMTLDVEVDGSGEAPGTFDVTLVAIKKGIGQAARAKMEEQLKGESFIINATSAKCFADKKSDPDAEADKVSCKVLSDATDDSASTLRATVVTRMKFDQATRQPAFTATKFVIRGKSKI